MLAQLITETLLGALTGYITNDTAIRSLFKPGGVIEQTRDDFAYEAGQLLETQVLTLAVLQHQLMLPEVQDVLAKALHHFLQNELPKRFETLTVGDLPDHDAMIAHLQSILLQFATTERDTVLYYLKKYFPIDELLTEAQCTKLADTLEQILSDVLIDSHLAEQIWQTWMREKGNGTLESLELDALCRTVMENLVKNSDRWLQELVEKYEEQLKDSAMKSMKQLHLDRVLLELDTQMETYTLR